MMQDEGIMKEQNCNEEETADNRGLNTRGRLPCQQPETITIWLGIDGNTAEERDQDSSRIREHKAKTRELINHGKGGKDPRSTTTTTTGKKTKQPFWRDENHKGGGKDPRSTTTPGKKTKQPLRDENPKGPDWIIPKD